jgi:hypothetical protein
MHARVHESHAALTRRTPNTAPLGRRHWLRAQHPTCAQESQQRGSVSESKDSGEKVRGAEATGPLHGCDWLHVRWSFFLYLDVQSLKPCAKHSDCSRGRAQPRSTAPLPLLRYSIRQVTSRVGSLGCQQASAHSFNPAAVNVATQHARTSHFCS